MFSGKSYINVIMLLRVIGWLLLIEMVFMSIPLVTSLIYHEECFSSFLISIGITAGAGLIMMSLRPKNKDMGKREAILLTASVWVVFSLFGMLPFLLSGSHMSVTDAFFETMSGFTTTGLSVLPSIDALPHGIIIWRCVMQWVGGMGIILFTLAVLPMLNYQGGMQLFNAEVSGITHDKLRPRVSSTAKSLWVVYLSLSLILTLLLVLSDMDWFDAICYGMSTMSTGGFATSDAGIGQWNSYYIKIIFCIFMFLGGVNFGLIYKAATGKWDSLRTNTAFKWYVWIIIISTAILAGSILLSGVGKSITDVTIDPLFQTISIISSTGLTESGFSSWGHVAICVMMFLLFLGACAGSTSGGAKIDRLILCVKNIKNEFYRIMHPNAVLTIRINGKGTPDFLIQKTIVFLIIYIMVILVAGIALIALGIPVQTGFFAALEAVSNTGLGVNMQEVASTYGDFPTLGKWIISLVMLIGRLELFTVLLLFTTSFWRK